MMRAMIALLLLVPALAAAETMLPLTCTKPATSTCAEANRIFDYPTPETIVWDGGSYKPFASVTRALVCTKDIEPGLTTTTQCPTANKVVVSKALVRTLREPLPPGNVDYTDAGVLTWTVDGSDPLLPQLTGFRIEYGLDGVFNQRIAVPAQVRSHTIAGLPAGTWWFRVFANVGLIESGSSPIATKLIAPPAEPEPPPAEQWRIAPIASGTRPIYEAVANADSSAWVQGNREGQAQVGTLCGDEVYRTGTAGRFNSYRVIAEGDIALDSPTYRGRRHVALCVLD